jgi:hypothetical protein
MTDEEKTKAMRRARVIAQDIALYNQADVVKGIEQDNFFELLKERIDEARESYRSSVSAEIYKTTNFFDRAIIDIVIKSKANVKSRMW